MPRKTHCVNGHPKIPENIEANGGCKPCRLERVRAWRLANGKGEKDPRRVALGMMGHEASMRARAEREAKAAKPKRLPRTDDPAVMLYREHRRRNRIRIARLIEQAKQQLADEWAHWLDPRSAQGRAKRKAEGKTFRKETAA